MAATYPLRLPADQPLLTVTRPEPTVWILELHSTDDARLTHALLRAMQPALDAVERDWRTSRRGKDIQKEKDRNVGAGALVLVGNRKQDKFFSNGLDYPVASKDSSFFPDTYNPVMRRLLTFPIPVVAAINGHCFAGGFGLALASDYRVMVDGAARNAWMCMNEIHFGSSWPRAFAALFRAKAPDVRAHRLVALEGARITPPQARELGLVDVVHGTRTEEVLERAVQLARERAPEARAGAYGLIKTDLYRDVLDASMLDNRPIMPDVDDARARARL